MRQVTLCSVQRYHDPDRHTLGRARAAVADLLRTTDVDLECRFRVVLAVEELIDNATRHAGTPSVLTLCLRPDSVRVAVRDGSTEEPDIAAAAALNLGLSLVSRLSDALYLEADEAGTTVVAEIPRRRPSFSAEGDPRRVGRADEVAG